MKHISALIAFHASLFTIIILLAYHSLAASNCLTINSIEINNTNKYIDNRTNKITEKYLRKCINISDIKNIVREMCAEHGVKVEG